MTIARTETATVSGSRRDFIFRLLLKYFVVSPMETQTTDNGAAVITVPSGPVRYGMVKSGTVR